MTTALAISCTATAGAAAGCCLPYLARVATVHALCAEHAISEELQEARGLYRGLVLRAGGIGFAALAVASITILGATTHGIAIAFLLFALFLLAVIDFSTLLLPDIVTIPLAVAGLAVNTQSVLAPFTEAAGGALIGFSVLYIVHWTIFALTDADGMGFGDVKLVFAIGAWLGYRPLLHVLVVALLCAAIFGLAMIACRRTKKSRMIPFGPFLAIGAATTALLGTPLYAAAIV